MPVPILLYGAFTIMAFVFAPPSIILTGPLIAVYFWRRRVRRRRMLAAQAAAREERLFQERLAAVRRLMR